MTDRSLLDLALRLRVLRRTNRLEAYDQRLPVAKEVQEEKLRGFVHSFKWFASALGRMPNKRWTILEAGHGNNGYARFYAKLFEEVYGVDLKDYSAYHPGVKSLVADLTEWVPLPTGSVDLVVSHSVLEHVAGVDAALRSLDRVLKLGGYVYITVYGLYLSAEGAHVRTPDLQYKNWEHLDPASPYFLLESSPNTKSSKAGHLNGFRFSDFLSAFGRVPWDILKVTRSYDDRPIPGFVDLARFDELDLRTRGFKLLARKTREV